MFLQKSEKFSLSEIEEKVLKFWKENQIFEKSLTLRQARGKKFVFYEGPPTANGQPGIHHVLARVFKDIILRYKTMAGFYVLRKGGWDTHGLPVEIEVEKQLGLKSKKDIEKYGIAEFNNKCKESVWKYKDEWEKLTERIGFWLDLKNPYVTYKNSYIETLWWIFSQIAKRKLLYKGHKIVLWCTRCGTILSSHEVALGYREIEENSVYLKFKLNKGQKLGNFTTNDKTHILSWTTTPWTLPGNVALAVGENIDYKIVKNQENGEVYVLAAELIATTLKANKLQDISNLKGKALIGLKYEPLFNVAPLKTKTSYKVYPASFVTITEGTGVVHTAVMYGEDDYNLGKEAGLPQRHTVDEQGNFTKDVPGLAGMYVKAKETEGKILNHLKIHNSLFKIQSYTHEYPFCWRCDTPLLYYARDSWFIAMSKLRKELLRENKKINWVPASLREGRFGEWLKEVKDWAISRERYWGTPLPVWQCNKCKNSHVIGDFEELENLQGKSTNRYILIRHGQAQSNIGHTVSGWPEKAIHHLTLLGRVQTEKLAKKLKKIGVDLIFSSDITRTKETEKILADAIEGEKVFFDKRLREINTGDFNGCHDNDYHKYFTSDLEKFTKRPPNGETLTDLRKRVFEFINEIEKKYRGKTIVIVSHEYPIWMLESAMLGWDEEESIKEKHSRGKDFINTGEMREVPFRVLPRDETGKFDVHKPYIDKIVFSCKKCGDKMTRVPEVIDVWFDSGAMPFAQAHFPFTSTKIQNSKFKIQNSVLDYPADYIAEGIDQTRGWFYTLLAIGVLLQKGASYKNVISHGLVLDKNGQKMSKSKGNVVDPWTMVQKYGADTLRWYFYTINPPAEPKRFDENDLAKNLRQFILIVYNSFIFFDLYAKKNFKFKILNFKLTNVLDRWILARLNETIDAATKNLNKYEIGDAAKTIAAFVDDLSRWYIRRSRRKFQKPDPSADGKKDFLAASQTLSYIMLELSKLLAPFAPFLAEALYKSLNHESRIMNYGSKRKRKRIHNSKFIIPNSVHLTDWPKANKRLIDKKLLAGMEEIRRLASLALAKRAEVGIKVRQPLASLKITNDKYQITKNKELLNILKDEINVEEITVDEKMKDEIWLDTELTHELREEGWLREFVRLVQGLRKDAGLEPKDKIILLADLPDEPHHVISKNESFVKNKVGAEKIEYRRFQKFDVELETKIGEWPVWLAIKKQP